MESISCSEAEIEVRPEDLIEMARALRDGSAALLGVLRTLEDATDQAVEALMPASTGALQDLVAGHAQALRSLAGVLEGMGDDLSVSAFAWRQSDAL